MEEQYTISELADAAGVTPRTVRYYTTEGLMPPADMRGKYALYSRAHLLRLQLIAQLKESYLPLGEIRARLERLTPEQIEQLLEEARRAPKQVIAESAADYIAQLRLQPSTLPMPAAAPAQAGSDSFAAGRVEPETPRMGVGNATPPPAPAPGAAPVAPVAARSGILSRFTSRRRETPELPATPQPEPWQRIVIVPGVELHYRETVSPELRAQIDRLIVEAQAQLVLAAPEPEPRADH
jgi:DNA-binding transcriptional MerR regulator